MFGKLLGREPQSVAQEDLRELLSIPPKGAYMSFDFEATVDGKGSCELWFKLYVSDHEPGSASFRSDSMAGLIERVRQYYGER